jgi:hypothetical protein
LPFPIWPNLLNIEGDLMGEEMDSSVITSEVWEFAFFWKHCTLHSPMMTNGFLIWIASYLIFPNDCMLPAILFHLSCRQFSSKRVESNLQILYSPLPNPII